MTVRDLYEIAEITNKLDHEIVIKYQDKEELKDYPVSSVKFQDKKIIVEIIE